MRELLDVLHRIELRQKLDSAWVTNNPRVFVEAIDLILKQSLEKADLLSNQNK